MSNWKRSAVILVACLVLPRWVGAAPVGPTTNRVDAFIDMGAGPYPSDQDVTTGGSRPWYQSPQVAGLFGGVPTAQQRSDFEQAVLQRVERTFQLGGVPLTATLDPNVPADHTLSVVSNTSGAAFPDAIGETVQGQSGFNFIDRTAASAQNVDQLEWLVAHNVSHELMLALGLGEDYDKSGNFIDARNANMSMMLDPKATFSRDASQALLNSGSLADGSSDPNAASAFTSIAPAAEMLAEPQPVPEPSTVAVWLAALALAVVARRS